MSGALRKHKDERAIEQWTPMLVDLQKCHQGLTFKDTQIQRVLQKVAVDKHWFTADRACTLKTVLPHMQKINYVL